MDPLPHVNKEFSLIIQDEKQRNISTQMIGKTSDVIAFVVKDRLPTNLHLKCDRYNCIGHTNENYRQHLQCDHCGYMGTADICRKLKRANIERDKRGPPSNSYTKAHHANSKSNKAEATPFSYSLTVDQYCDFLEIINRTKSKQ